MRFKTGDEIFVVILRKISTEAFLSFAGIEPYYVNEDNDQVLEIIGEYFPEGVEDVADVDIHLPEEDEEQEEEEEDEEESEEEEEEEDQLDIGYGIIDYSLF